MKTKILIAAMLIVSTFTACKDEKTEEKTQMNEVMKVHDAAMGNSELAMKNKGILDSLIKTATDTAKLTVANGLKQQLTRADEAMEDWMHKFNPDFAGKSHTEIMDYLKAQHAQVLKVDSMLKSANNSAAKYTSAK